jgi:hypothetical protein
MNVEALKAEYKTVIAAFLNAVTKGDFEGADRIKVRLMEIQALVPGIGLDEPKPEQAVGRVEAEWVDRLYREIWGEDDAYRENQIDNAVAEKAGKPIH